MKRSRKGSRLLSSFRPPPPRALPFRTGGIISLLRQSTRTLHGLQRVARSIESENRKPMNQDSALLNYLSSNAPSLGIYIHNRSGPPNEDFGRPYSGPRRVL
jgi:hypothetical protein